MAETNLNLHLNAGRVMHHVIPERSQLTTNINSGPHYMPGYSNNDFHLENVVRSLNYYKAAVSPAVTANQPATDFPGGILFVLVLSAFVCLLFVTLGCIGASISIAIRPADNEPDSYISERTALRRSRQPEPDPEKGIRCFYDVFPKIPDPITTLPIPMHDFDNSCDCRHCITEVLP